MTDTHETPDDSDIDPIVFGGDDADELESDESEPAPSDSDPDS